MSNMTKSLTQKVVLKIVSSRGHDEITDTAINVMERIKHECDSNGKWAYLNGQQRSPGSISLDDLLSAEDLTITNALVGG